MAALELPYIGLDDALAICLLMSRQGDARFERAAVRWLARLCLEHPSISLTDLRQAAAAISALPTDPENARRALAEVCQRVDLPRAAQLLSRRA